MQRQKRPVYCVVKGTGVYDDKGQEYVTIIEVKMTSAAAELLAGQVGGKVVKKFLT
jgi:hypothetical protein